MTVVLISIPATPAVDQLWLGSLVARWTADAIADLGLPGNSAVEVVAAGTAPFEIQISGRRLPVPPLEPSDEPGMAAAITRAVLAHRVELVGSLDDAALQAAADPGGALAHIEPGQLRALAVDLADRWFGLQRIAATGPRAAAAAVGMLGDTLTADGTRFGLDATSIDRPAEVDVDWRARAKRLVMEAARRLVTTTIPVDVLGQSGAELQTRLRDQLGLPVVMAVAATDVEQTAAVRLRINDVRLPPVAADTHVDTLFGTLRPEAFALIDEGTVRFLLARQGESEPALAAMAIAAYGIPVITGVMRELLRDDVGPPGDLWVVLEAMLAVFGSAAATPDGTVAMPPAGTLVVHGAAPADARELEVLELDPLAIADAVRPALGRREGLEPHTDTAVRVVTAGPEIERLLRSPTPMSEDLHIALAAAVRARGLPVLVGDRVSRRTLTRLLRPAVPGVVVLARDEVPAWKRAVIAGRLDVGDAISSP